MTREEFHRRVGDQTPHRDALVDVLRRLIGHAYPPEVVSVDFEVFCDGFSLGAASKAREPIIHRRNHPRARRGRTAL